FISLFDLSRDELQRLLVRAAELKKARFRHGRPLAGHSVGLLFEKPSTRTRVSFEVAAVEMGAHPVALTASQTQVSRGEEPGDTAMVLSRYVSGLVVRTFGNDRLKAMAAKSSVPVINGLTDELHPCQTLADLLTIQERLGSLEGVTVAYVGDGNNVANSWIEAAIHTPIKLKLGCPDALRPDAKLLEQAGSRAQLTTDSLEAVKGADVVYTDVWVSMGQSDADARRELLRPYQVNRALMAEASSRALFMHCLPAHRDEEVSGELLFGDRSVVLDQAENRLHASKALLEAFLLPAS
ncbi:MAG: ornithine carbamoyltransferase, partial [Myxococcales bacterium]